MIMMWNKNLDRKIKEAGWFLDKKDEHGIVYKKGIYTRFYIKYKFVEILHNQITVYTLYEGTQKDTGRLTYKELELFTKKFKQIKKEYGWK